ncbi:hypothetical protein F511_27046 [Dorcoceras hygrometricum]|uniref:Uncharacterized protein n=1 Tax=Dorcoceras hygrometricum TaxID=472368 RepID=A0A2Z7BA69_9LAMI|nr:hypothetical protein F511_27046 [Dorcoceras hygrometricum]
MNSRASQGRTRPRQARGQCTASARIVVQRASTCSSMRRLRGCATSAEYRRPASKNVRAARDQGPTIVEPLREARGQRLGRDARQARISRSSNIVHSSGHLAPVACPARDVRMSIARPARDGVNTLLATRAWLQPELQERRLFTVGGGRSVNQVHDRNRSPSNQPALED